MSLRKGCVDEKATKKRSKNDELPTCFFIPVKVYQASGEQLLRFNFLNFISKTSECIAWLSEFIPLRRAHSVALWSYQKSDKG